MIIDIETLNSQIDLRTLAAQSTTLSGWEDSEERYGPCPRCQGEDRFHVKRDGFFCRQCKPLDPGWNNAIDYAIWLNDMDFRAACEWLANGNLPTLSEHKPKPAPRPRPRLTPPNKYWQTQVNNFIENGQEQLWRPSGKAGLDYLLGRGLTEATIKAADLGYNPRDSYDVPARWGLTGRNSIELLGPGIVIPWPIDNQIHRVNIRLLDLRHDKKGKEIKYRGPRGWAGANPLYNADTLRGDTPAILVEGEFCAMIINQVAGDLVTAVATGSTEAGRADKWIYWLAGCPLVLVAFDAEPSKGDKAALFWLERLPNARRLRPELKDVNDMHKAGIDVREWIEKALPWVPPDVARIAVETAESWPVTLYRNEEPVRFSSPTELQAATLPASVG